MGLDAALQALFGVPAGGVFVSAVALGFAFYGVCSVVRAPTACVLLGVQTASARANLVSTAHRREGGDHAPS